MVFALYLFIAIVAFSESGYSIGNTSLFSFFSAGNNEVENLLDSNSLIDTNTQINCSLGQEKCEGKNNFLCSDTNSWTN